jgi:hypothetical protein
MTAIDYLACSLILIVVLVAVIVTLVLRLLVVSRAYVMYDSNMRVTSIAIRDTLIVWCPWGPYEGHAVDLGYDRNGELVGVQIWDDVRRRKA